MKNATRLRYATRETFLKTASTHSVRLDVSCRVAADSMLTEGVGAMLVTQHGRACGVVTQEALARSAATGLRPLAQEYCACCASTAYLQVDTYDQLLCLECRCPTAESARTQGACSQINLMQPHATSDSASG